MRPVLREIVEEEAARAAVNDAMSRWPRAEDAWEAVTWIVMRDPSVGLALNEGATLRAMTLEGARSIGLPTVTIVYETGANQITVHSARFEDAKYGQAGRA